MDDPWDTGSQDALTVNRVNTSPPGSKWTWLCRLKFHGYILDWIQTPRNLPVLGHLLINTVEPLWKGQECLTKVAKFGPFSCTILYKWCLFYPLWQATSFERPPSWVAFIEGFDCMSRTVKNPTCITMNYISKIKSESILNTVKLASNDVGCICEQIWKEQCRMKTYIAVNMTKWYWSKMCIKLVITINNFLTFVMPLNWAAIIGYRLARGRPFYSNDVILLHQVTVPLHQGTVPLFGLPSNTIKWYNTTLHFIWNS